MPWTLIGSARGSTSEPPSGHRELYEMVLGGSDSPVPEAVGAGNNVWLMSTSSDVQPDMVSGSVVREMVVRLPTMIMSAASTIDRMKYAGSASTVGTPEPSSSTSLSLSLSQSRRADSFGVFSAVAMSDDSHVLTPNVVSSKIRVPENRKRGRVMCALTLDAGRKVPIVATAASCSAVAPSGFQARPRSSSIRM